MFSDEPADPAPAPESTAPEETAWQERSGLTLREAEDLLDWLEAHGVTQREARVTPEGCTVRWR
jgi:hypothetical protein